MKFRIFSILILLTLLLVSIAPLAAQEIPDTMLPKLEIIAQTEDTITVRHELGETELPASPQRIVAVTGTSELEALLAFGVQPIAAAGDDSDAGETVWVSHLEPLVEGVERLPSRRNTNLELVLAANPDLIIGSASWIGEIYEELSAIAPTVALDFNRPWQGVLRDVALLTGQQERAEELISDYAARVDVLVAQYRPAVEGLTYTQIKSFISAGDIQLYSDTLTNAGPILSQLGMIQPVEQIEAAGETGSAAVSLERIDLFDTAVIFLYRYPGEIEQSEIDALRENLLFANFAAVQQNRVFEVDSSWWYINGAVGAQRLLDDLEQTVLPALAAQTTECESGFRPFVDVREIIVCVPNVPQRIVAIHDSNAGAQVLSLGVPLVGMATRDGEFSPGITRYFDLSDVVPIGEYYTPNVELILTLQPDLIVHEGYLEGEVGTLYLEDGVLEALEAIAPVVAIDAFRPVAEVIADYEALLGDAAQVSGAEQQAELDQAIEELRALLGDDWRNVTVSWLGYFEGDLRTIGSRTVSITNILSEVGVQWSAITQEADQPENGGHLAGISFERLDLFNADLLIASLWDESLLDNPIYQALPVVQAGQAVELTGDVVRSMGGTHYTGYIDTARFLREQIEALMPLRTDIVTEAITEASN
jgi:iron complex transport system substrate-binding protein